MDIRTLTLKELESQGVAPEKLKRDLKIEYLDQLFIRVADLPKKFRQNALQRCREINQSGINSFLVESQWYLTIWQQDRQQISRIEEFNSRKDEKNTELTLNQDLELIATPERSNELLITQQVEKHEAKISQENVSNLIKYRGISYELPSLSKSQNQEQQPKKIKRVYRGQEY